MSLPYVETHLPTPMLIVDIEYNNGGFSRGHLCRSLSLEKNSLILYKDIVAKEKEYFNNVKHIDVTGECFGGAI